MVLSVIQKHIEPSLWALDFPSIYCKCPSSGVMGSVSLSWVSRQRGRSGAGNATDGRAFQIISCSFFPHLPIGAGWALDNKASRPWKRELSMCIYSDSSDLIPLMGSKLSLEEGRELQSIGLNPSLCSCIFILLHQLHTTVKPTQSTLGSLEWGKSLTRPLAEHCSCCRGFLAPGTGQTPPCRWVQSPEMLLLLGVPTGWGCTNPSPKGGGLEVPMSWGCS